LFLLQTLFNYIVGDFAQFCRDFAVKNCGKNYFAFFWRRKNGFLRQQLAHTKERHLHKNKQLIIN